MQEAFSRWFNLPSGDIWNDFSYMGSYDQQVDEVESAIAKYETTSPGEWNRAVSISRRRVHPTTGIDIMAEVFRPVKGLVILREHSHWELYREQGVEVTALATILKHEDLHLVLSMLGEHEASGRLDGRVLDDRSTAEQLDDWSVGLPGKPTLQVTRENRFVLLECRELSRSAIAPLVGR
ncbi:MAG: hypothetical protein KGJ23_07745 [Euryarchaeota archaeon]|nr:hypothetical protein [Euryarchaeota archaeon]MDE2044698.1 hypothetical protein [Thermoplasmata archaeon]